MDDVNQGAKQQRLPSGMHPCKLDDRARLKLPSGYAKHFKELGENALFCTSLDRRVGHIYTLPAWQDIEGLLDNLENTDRAERLRFTANDLGDTVEIDSQDRIVLPQKL